MNLINGKEFLEAYVYMIEEENEYLYEDLLYTALNLDDYWSRVSNIYKAQLRFEGISVNEIEKVILLLRRYTLNIRIQNLLRFRIYLGFNEMYIREVNKYYHIKNYSAPTLIYLIEDGVLSVVIFKEVLDNDKKITTQYMWKSEGIKSIFKIVGFNSRMNRLIKKDKIYNIVNNCKLLTGSGENIEKFSYSMINSLDTLRNYEKTLVLKDIVKSIEVELGK